MLAFHAGHNFCAWYIDLCIGASVTKCKPHRNHCSQKYNQFGFAWNIVPSTKAFLWDQAIICWWRESYTLWENCAQDILYNLCMHFIVQHINFGKTYSMRLPGHFHCPSHVAMFLMLCSVHCIKTPKNICECHAGEDVHHVEYFSNVLICDAALSTHRTMQQKWPAEYSDDVWARVNCHAAVHMPIINFKRLFLVHNAHITKISKIVPISLTFIEQNVCNNC